MTSTVPVGPGYAGPSGVPALTVKQLLAHGVDDQFAALTGKLVRHTGSENYVFSDASSEIQVEIAPKYFPVHQTIDANTVVILTGRFDKERFGPSQPEIEQIVLLK